MLFLCTTNFSSHRDAMKGVRQGVEVVHTTESQAARMTRQKYGFSCLEIDLVKEVSVLVTSLFADEKETRSKGDDQRHSQTSHVSATMCM